MALDAEDEKKIAALFAAAMAGEDFKKAVGVVAGEAIKGAVKGLDLDTKLGALDAKIVESVKPKDPPDPDPKTGTGKIEDSPEYKRAMSKLAEVEKMAKQQQDRAETAEKARQAELLTSGLRDALLANGVDPKKIGLALGALKSTAEIKLDDKGQAVWKQKTAWGEDFVPVADAAKVWVATDDGKTFLPPVGAQGTGEGAGNGGRNRQGGVSAMGILGQAIANLP